MKEQVCIAGPMSLQPNQRWRDFFHAENALRANGFRPVNPVAGYVVNRNQRRGLRRAVNIAMLVHCDRILMLWGWQLSEDARRMHNIAEWIGITIHYDHQPLSDIEATS